MSYDYDDTPESSHVRSVISRVRSSAAYQSLRAQFKQHCATARNPDGTIGLPCWYCHKEPINYQAGHHDPLSFELDHDLSVAERPDLALSWNNFRPAHKVCNRRRGRVDADTEDMRAMLGEPSEAW